MLAMSFINSCQGSGGPCREAHNPQVSITGLVQKDLLRTRCPMPPVLPSFPLRPTRIKVLATSNRVPWCLYQDPCYSGKSPRGLSSAAASDDAGGTFIQQEVGKPEDEAPGGFFKQIDSSPIGSKTDKPTTSQNYCSGLSQPSTPSPPKPTGIFQTSANSSFEPVKAHLVGVKPVEADRANVVGEVRGTSAHQKQRRPGAAPPDASPGNLEQPPDNMETLSLPQLCALPLTTPAEASHGLLHARAPPLESVLPAPEKRPSTRAQGAGKCESPATTLWAQNELPDFGGNVLLAPAAPALHVPAKPRPPEVIQPPDEGLSGRQSRQPVPIPVPTVQSGDAIGASENLENPPQMGEEEALQSQASPGYASLLSSPPTDPSPADAGQQLLPRPPRSSSASVVSTSSSQAAARSDQQWPQQPPPDLASYYYYRHLYDGFQSPYPPDPGPAPHYYQDVYGLYDPRYRPYDSATAAYADSYRYPEPERPSSRASHCSDRPAARQGYPEGYYHSKSGWSSQSDYYANYYSSQYGYGAPGRWDRYHYGSQFRDPRSYDRGYWYNTERDAYRKESCAYGDRLVTHTLTSQIYRSHNMTAGSYEAPPPPGSLHDDYAYSTYGGSLHGALGFPEYSYPADAGWPSVEHDLAAAQAGAGGDAVVPRTSWQTVVGTDIAELLLRDHRTVWLPGKSPNEANLIDFTNEAVEQVEEEESGEAQLSFLTDNQAATSLEKETERFRELLLYGRKKVSQLSSARGGARPAPGGASIWAERSTGGLVPQGTSGTWCVISEGVGGSFS
ncbi:hypothetical protein CB1_000725002 [Camelus ferus]|nr:hypothetical protein CB1_000725002 [Camelus ferus]